MFGLGKGNDDNERFWNFLIFKFYGTDKELEEASPVLGIIVIVVFVVILIWSICSLIYG